MKKIFLLLFLSLTACNKNMAPPFTTINDEFKTYVERYNQIRLEETGHPAGYYPVEFGELSNPDMLGSATISGNNCWIKVSQLHWNGLNQNGKKELIFHELLHCDYVGAIHISGTLLDAFHQRTQTPEEDLRFIFRNY